MKNEILVVVDMQNDFITGTLGSQEAKGIVEHVVEYVKKFEGKIFFTRDTHEANYLDTQEGKKLPVEHCIRNTNGWEIFRELQKFTEKAVIVDKITFGSTELPQKIKQLHEEQEITKIILMGLCTDICVISNAMILKASFPEVPVQVVENCCAGVSVETHKNALEAMKMCQIEIV